MAFLDNYGTERRGLMEVEMDSYAASEDKTNIREEEVTDDERHVKPPVPDCNYQETKKLSKVPTFVQILLHSTVVRLGYTGQRTNTKRGSMFQQFKKNNPCFKSTVL